MQSVALVGMICIKTLDELISSLPHLSGVLGFILLRLDESRSGILRHQV